MKDEKYRLGTCRGNGGYGMVYTGYNVNYEDSVAIKYVVKNKNCDFYSNLRELSFLYSSFHPNIIALNSVNFEISEEHKIILDNDISELFSEDEELDDIHLEMEMGKLNFHSFTKKKVKYKTLKFGFLQICLALEYIHHQNIIHGDLKPENVLCISKDKNVLMKLCDFGLSFPISEQFDNPRGLYTCYYRPPEMCICENNLYTNEGYDTRVDVWALGCIFFEVISGKMLFNTHSDECSEIYSEILRILPNKCRDEEIEGMESTFVKYFPINSSNIVEEMIKIYTIEEFHTFIFLLINMLQINYKNRMFISEVIDHYYFEEYNLYIKQIRENYLKFKDTKMIKPIPCLEREYFLQIFENLWNQDTIEKRILVHTIRIFDMYLKYKEHNDKDICLDLILKIFVIIYMLSKFFNVITEFSSFKSFFENNSTGLNNIDSSLYLDEKYENCKSFEKLILKNVCEFNIYEKTLFEQSDFYIQNISKNGNNKPKKMQLSKEQRTLLLNCIIKLDYENGQNIKNVFEKIIDVGERDYINDKCYLDMKYISCNVDYPDVYKNNFQSEEYDSEDKYQTSSHLTIYTM